MAGSAIGIPDVGWTGSHTSIRIDFDSVEDATLAKQLLSHGLTMKPAVPLQAEATKASRPASGVIG